MLSIAYNDKEGGFAIEGAYFKGGPKHVVGVCVAQSRLCARLERIAVFRHRLALQLGRNACKKLRAKIFDYDAGEEKHEFTLEMKLGFSVQLEQEGPHFKEPLYLQMLIFNCDTLGLQVSRQRAQAGSNMTPDC